MAACHEGTSSFTVLTSSDTIRLIRDGRRWGKREMMYLSPHCHHQNDSCIRVGSNESHLIFVVTTTTQGKRGFEVSVFI